jgi:hypothetical protein
MNIFYRQNRYFKIDTTQLSGNALNPQNINALYSAVYKEFIGAVKNPKYKDLTPMQKMTKLNQFAQTWLTTKGLL